MSSSLSDSENNIPSTSTDELQFHMDDDQIMIETSAAEKSNASVQQDDTTDEIWRNIENSRVRFPMTRDDHRQGLKRSTTLKSPNLTGPEGEVVIPTTDHDSSKQSASASPMGTDGVGGGRDGESSDKDKSGRGSLDNKTILKPSPSVGTSLLNLVTEATSAKSNGTESSSSSMMDEAWERLRSSFVYFQKKPVGTLAALDPSAEALNYNQVFVRDFVPTALACLMRVPDPEPEIVKNFLLKTLHLQGWKKTIDNFTLGEGVMPASFKVMYDSYQEKDVLKADFGGSAIGRVAPVDSGFWWIILLRSYTKCTGDYTLSERPEVQKGMKLILNLCLSDGFDTFPTLLCADGCSMIDRRMGIYGYPIEIQALFFFALRCAQQMLKQDSDSNRLIERIERRITALSYHIRNYYWLDFTQLNNIYRYKTEEYSHTAVNKFNVIPESIPDWVFDFMPLRGGYFIGNVSPARMDFRWFLIGNCIAILSSLATLAQATAIMDLVEERWEDLIGEMPLKIAYPALEGYQWRIVTGCDPKNIRWSYHNGGSWPVLLWLLTAACIKAGRPQIAKRAIELVEQRLSKDGWPEYYDGKKGRYIGKQARKYQTWSISGYLVAKLMIENPSNLAMISLEEDKKIEKPRLTRSASWSCSR
ncbi:probable alkaline/neutral invertase F [Cynara cardunculus var. scolymus]|uniref:probable alkaline/neutral invertase F n=1 Tax=Cynara cardunculus var. scolymus TaxID=59895 RepID=UPI000D62C7C5|nr:probable alkaline/neutral invertase F [Cynara cardunculus var. scolymus]